MKCRHCFASTWMFASRKAASMPQSPYCTSRRLKIERKGERTIANLPRLSHRPASPARAVILAAGTCFFCTSVRTPEGVKGTRPHWICRPPPAVLLGHAR